MDRRGLLLLCLNTGGNYFHMDAWSTWETQNTAALMPRWRRSGIVCRCFTKDVGKIKRRMKSRKLKGACAAVSVTKCLEALRRTDWRLWIGVLQNVTGSRVKKWSWLLSRRSGWKIDLSPFVADKPKMWYGPFAPERRPYSLFKSAGVSADLSLQLNSSSSE